MSSLRLTRLFRANRNNRNSPPRFFTVPALRPSVLFFSLCLTVGVSFPSMAAAAESASPRASSDQRGSVSGRVSNAVTGRYLGLARVSIKGSEIETFTDEIGRYTLAGVPAGSATLQVFYTGLDAQEVAIVVSAGASIEKNVQLASKTRYGEDPDLARLDPFMVVADKETNNDALAINEQRFAPNIKNVMATNGFGDALGNSAGDFLRYIPGLTPEWDNIDVTAISVRGIGGGMTTFQRDGASIVSANNNPPSRIVEMKSTVLTNITRIEVTKVPLPSHPADVLGGTVNMVTKSAFEADRAELNYNVTLLANYPDNLLPRKVRNPFRDEYLRRTTPGYSFDYSVPINKRFGIALTAAYTPRYNEQYLIYKNWNFLPAGATGASVSNPYMMSFQHVNYPRFEARTNYSARVDWKLTQNSVLSVGGQWGRYEGKIGGNIFLINAGNNGTSTIAGGVPLTFGPDFTNGATGRGSVTLTGHGQLYIEDSWGGNMNYRFDDGRWKIDSFVSYSASERTRPSFKHDMFFGMTSTLKMPVRVNFSGFGPYRPAVFEAFDNNNNPVDIYNLDNYQLTTTVDHPIRMRAAYVSGAINARRRLNAFSFPAALQIGGKRSVQRNDGEVLSWGTTFNGPDGNPATADSVRPYEYQTWVSQNNPLGLKDFPALSTYRAIEAWKKDPRLFGQTLAQEVGVLNTEIINSTLIEEEVSSLYLQAEAKLLQSRLNVVTGVRYEGTDVDAVGPLVDPAAVFVRNPDGTFARNAAGARIRRPEAGAAGSVEQLLLTTKRRAAPAKKSYDGFFPSLHLTYNFKDNFLGRLAYARTYGRPAFAEVIPSVTVNQADVVNAGEVPGNLTVRNPALKPWMGDNYDFSLEYYTGKAGVISVGAFYKDIKDFFGAVTKIATEEDLAIVGLDSEYVGYLLSTKFNAGDASITGYEVNYRQSLNALGGWGRHVTVFANGTKLKLKGNPFASFNNFTPEAANWGFTFAVKRFSGSLKWNYQGETRLAARADISDDAYQYNGSRVMMDVSFAYELTKRLSLVLSANNVTDVAYHNKLYGSASPMYSRTWLKRHYGTPVALAIKGRM